MPGALSAPVGRRVPARASVSRPREVPSGDARLLVEGHRLARCPHNGANAGCDGLHLYADDSYVEGPLVSLMAWAYFLWTACGLTPAQAAIRAQL